MLLTKPLTKLLSSSLHTPLTTLLLITPTGQLLASASPLPSSILRSRATLGISIWNLYSENKNAISEALPEQGADDIPRGEEEDGEQGKPIQTITVQLTLGILTIRLLSCGLLVMGIADLPTATPAHTNFTSSGLPSPSTSQRNTNSSNSHTQNPPSNQGSLRGKGKQIFASSSPPAVDGLRSSAASDAGSTSTTTGRGREVQAVRRRTEEVAKWLERELAGFRVAEGI